MERVILVGRDDRELGTAEKMEAHRQGLLHRAFSVFILNSRDEVLLQRRAEGKYHSGGLWSNACCSHPRPGEGIEQGARRRLREEMGLEAPLERVGRFIYRARLGPDLWEHELDHVLLGRSDQSPTPDPTEVSGWRWVSLAALKDELHARPDDFTVWLERVLESVLSADG